MDNVFSVLLVENCHTCPIDGQRLKCYIDGQLSYVSYVVKINISLLTNSNKC